MKYIDEYEIQKWYIPDNVLKAIKQYIQSNGVSVTINSVKKDTDNYHVEFTDKIILSRWEVFKSISIPTYEIERTIRNNKINEILN